MLFEGILAGLLLVTGCFTLFGPSRLIKSAADVKFDASLEVFVFETSIPNEMKNQ